MGTFVFKFGLLQLLHTLTLERPGYVFISQLICNATREWISVRQSGNNSASLQLTE